MPQIYAYLQLIALATGCCCLATRTHFYYYEQPLLQSQAEALPNYTNNYERYIVSIQLMKPNLTFFGDNHYCAGIIIAPRYVLTSSHCVFDNRYRRHRKRAEELLLIAGTPQRLRPTKDTVILHVEHITPYLSHKVSQKHDLAMLRLRETIDLNVSRALGFAELDDYTTRVSTNCTVLGWGQHGVSGPFANVLLELQFRLLSELRCSRIYRSFFHHSMLCAIPLPSATKDVCRGDSGGPLFCDNKLIGVVSRGVRCDRHYPTIFTAILPHRQWIVAVSGAPSVCQMLYLICLIYLS